VAIVSTVSRQSARRWSPALAVSLIVAGVAAGGVPPLYGAAGAAGLVVVLLAVANPVLGLATLSLAVPLSPSGLVDRLPLTPTDVLAAVVLASAFASRLARRRLQLTTTGAFWPSALFVGVLVLSTAGASDVFVSVKEVLRWVELLGILVLTATVCQNALERRLVTFALLLGLTTESLIGWIQFLFRRGPDGFRVGSFLRAYGTFGQPNPFAGYLVMTLPLAFAAVVWLGRTKPGHRSEHVRLEVFLLQAAIIAAVVGTVALLMSLSRGALLGVGAAILVLAMLYTQRGGLISAAIATAALVVIFGSVTSLLPGVVGDRLAQIWEFIGWFDAARVVPTPQNWAVVERMAHWQAGWNMYFSNPILGVGPGHYTIAYPIYRVNAFWKDPLGHAHNLYLNVMAEDGFLGIVAYLGQLAAWIVIALAGFRRGQTAADRALAAGVVASLLGVAVHNLFDNLTVHGLGIETGILLGLAASIGRRADVSSPESV
jgi:putative inorganic carbon (hco3(-)) transporter